MSFVETVQLPKIETGIFSEPTLQTIGFTEQKKQQKSRATDRVAHPVALTILSKMGGMLLFGGAFFLSCTTPVNLGAGLAIFAVSTVPVLLSGISTWSRSDWKDDSALTKFFSFGAANIMSNGYSGIYLHEQGHAFAANCFYVNPGTRIKIIPFVGGLTTYNRAAPLRCLGAALSPRTLTLAITAAGMGATLLTATLAIVAAHYLCQTKPILSDFLLGHGIMQIATEVGYGLTTFTADPMDLSHDFMRLWSVGGIHPLIPISILVCMPIAAMVLMKQRNQNSQQT